MSLRAPGMAAPAAIGLTGGIGSGKSTVAAMLVELGAHLVDTDAIARRLTAPSGEAMPLVRAEFGPAFVADDGSLDRARMRERAFADASAKARLEAILHPLIGTEAQRQAQAAAGRPVVFDVPLLTPGSAWRARVARVLVVDCSEATQALRVAARPGWSEAMARSVIAQQIPRVQRRALADAVIHNDGLTLDALRAEVSALWRLWDLWQPGCEGVQG
jgi:dephospho-CoA kinase